MVTVELDENRYFTGIYCNLGSKPNGVLVPSLPPDLSNDKTTCWKYDRYEESTEIKVPVYGKDELVPVVDETTNLQKMDNQGQPIFKTVRTEDSYRIEKKTTVKVGWIFDEDKYEALREEILLTTLREKREEAFIFIDKMQLPLYYNSLSEEQREALALYRQQWLDVTETKQIPQIPDCLRK